MNREHRRVARARISPSRVLVAVAGLVLGIVVVWQLTSVAVAGFNQLFGVAARVAGVPSVELHQTYAVTVGDTVDGIAAKFGIQPAALIRANHLRHPYVISPGQKLIIPTAFHPAITRGIIRATAARYHLDPAFAVGLADEESGFDENVVSGTGAIGVMQIEPATGRQIAEDLGRTVDLGLERDNITVGIYYLSYLVRYYGGDERMAAAAYYQGQGSLARYGELPGTSQYVANVMALRQRYSRG